MNKYKLKKWYPSLPKDWEVGMEVGIGDRSYGNYSPCNGKYKDFYICAEIVENNPEFWEKVVEKDWEVLKTEYIPGKRGFDTDDTSSMYKITSIKRKCDREIFSVGDKVKGRGVIIAIEESNNRLCMEFSVKKCTEGIVWLEKLEKLKEPILITEDGVEIFEGDTPFLWKVTDDFDIVYDHYEITEGYKFFIKGRTFSTREAAKKWIDENKPIYSKKDMLSFGASMSPILYPYQCEGCLEQWKKYKKGE